MTFDFPRFDLVCILQFYIQTSNTYALQNVLQNKMQDVMIDIKVNYVELQFVLQNIIRHAITERKGEKL